MRDTNLEWSALRKTKQRTQDQQKLGNTLQHTPGEPDLRSEYSPGTGPVTLQHRLQGQ